MTERRTSSGKTRTPVEQMVDGIVKCVRCGGGIDCGCWSPVTIQCPTCRRSQRTTREPEDGDAAVVMVTCPECVEKEQRT